jgi:hypothetical protein
MSEALGTSRGRVKLTPDEWKMLQEHLTVILDRDKHIVEFGWASGCEEEPCTFPGFTVVFYSCPQRPCPVR